MQSTPLACYLVPPRYKYYPQHHVLKYPQLSFLPQWQQPSFKPIQTTVKVIVLYILIYFVVSYSIIYTFTEIQSQTQHLLVFRKSPHLSRKLLARHFKTRDTKICTMEVRFN